MTEVIEYNKYLPSYRSLLNPNARYDYKTHMLVPLLQLEINSLVVRFQKAQQLTKKSSLKMKYRSLLSDVSMKAQRFYLTKRLQLPYTLAATRTLWSKCTSITQLPIEIQALILTCVDDKQTYLNCMRTSRGMYHIAKPFLYKSVSFTSTYRFAQFVSCLRFNASLGLYVLQIDLSGIKSGEIEIPEEHLEAADNEDNSADEVTELLSNTLAGWRDWKYKNNPLYALHPAPAVPLTKVHSSVSIQSQSALKRVKISKYFKRRRSHSESGLAGSSTTSEASHTFNHPILTNQNTSAHPKINKFLLNYAHAKDVPLGYILHVINMCPNLESLNLANLTFSTDYRIKLAYIKHYQGYDLMNNFPKAMRKTLDEIGPVQLQNLSNPFWTPCVPTKFDITSSASSVFSLGTLTKPIFKYNSLLPPLGQPVAELTYFARGDRKVFLSDLNLRAINNNHLVTILPNEIFASLGKTCYSIKEVNMSSMIWINVKLVRSYLLEVLHDSLLTELVDGTERILYNGNSFEINDESPDPKAPIPKSEQSKLRELDLSNSGMYKNLGWAKKINLNTVEGQTVVYRILNDEVMTDFEEYVIRDRIRRGRPGENYFS